jgi:predicted GIY-YIG superfamily endonuclease
MDSYFVYMLQCSDGTYYVGITNDPDRRVAEHNLGLDEKAYTHRRPPVRLVHSSAFHEVLDAVRARSEAEASALGAPFDAAWFPRCFAQGDTWSARGEVGRSFR